MNRALSSVVWKKLMVLGQKQGSIRLTDLALEMNLKPEEALGFMRQIFPAGSGMEVYHKNNEYWVDLKTDAIQYMLPLSPAEWIQLHQILDNFSGPHTAITQSLRRKVTENGPIRVVMDLVNQIDLWDQELSEHQQQMIYNLEAAIQERQLIGLATVEGREYVLVPCKILHLEGQLSLIAEDFEDHCLTVVPLKEVHEYRELQKGAPVKVTTFEVEEFIAAIRAMNERETRLILKIHDPQSINLFPDHHFLGKPCMITNPQGDLIWAAYVEPCESLFEWLMTLGKHVEILDPLNFREEYLIYCEEKLRKIA